MATNRSQLRTKFRQEMRTDTSGKIWTDTIVNDLFTRAHLKFQRDGQFNWPENQGDSDTISLVAGTREYAYATDLGRMEFLMLGTNKLKDSDFETVTRKNPNNNQGKPFYYYLRGANIGFEPVPDGNDSSVTMYYRGIVSPPTDDTTNLTLRDDYVPAIVKYMAFLAWSQPSGNPQRAASKLGEYGIEIKTLRDAFQIRDNAVLNYKVQRSTNNYSRSDVL